MPAVGGEISTAKTLAITLLPKDEDPPPREEGALGWISVYLWYYRHTGRVMLSSEMAGISRTALVRTRLNHPEFAEAEQEALAEAVDRLEGEAWHRAFFVSDRMLAMLLQAYKPERFKQQFSVKHSGAIGAESLEVPDIPTDLDRARDVLRVLKDAGIDLDEFLATPGEVVESSFVDGESA